MNSFPVKNKDGTNLCLISSSLHHYKRFPKSKEHAKKNYIAPISEIHTSRHCFEKYHQQLLFEMESKNAKTPTKRYFMQTTSASRSFFIPAETFILVSATHKTHQASSCKDIISMRSVQFSAMKE